MNHPAIESIHYNLHAIVNIIWVHAYRYSITHHEEIKKIRIAYTQNSRRETATTRNLVIRYELLSYYSIDITMQK